MVYTLKKYYIYDEIIINDNNNNWQLALQSAWCQKKHYDEREKIAQYGNN